ncbi:MAG: type II restriction endonuclease [Pyrinomonadaceae bacterium]
MKAKTRKNSEHFRMRVRRKFAVVSFALLVCIFAIATCGSNAFGQTPKSAAIELGSKTAKNGFRNEDEIRDKFNNWRADEDARAWLVSMSYKLAEIESVAAAKPHGEKSDVDVVIKTKTGEKREGISIKLVSSPNGFNQIDKRWLRQYVKMWKMPANVETTLKYFLGETPPSKPGREAKRMYLNELDAESQKALIDFFTVNKEMIVSDLFEGDGIHAAGWVMVALKSTDKPRWIIRTSADTIRFFSEGPVELTRSGNLKIGRITMQRKGGDAGRETAKQLQFKINPALLFDAK